MQKFKFFRAGILAIGLAITFNASVAFAEVPNGHVSDDIPEPTEAITTIDTKTEITENTTPVETTENLDEVLESIEHEQTETLDESSATEPIVKIDKDELEGSPLEEMWPVYISLGGIALTLLLILIINIIHRKSKK